MTGQHSHPEAYIRARALSLWREYGIEAATRIAAMIEGKATLEELDLLGQERLTQASRRLLEYLLQPKWFQTPAVLGHARLFFSDLHPVATRDATLLDIWKSIGADCGEYVCYLLLDFVTADPDLADLPLATALELCGQLELDARFEKIAAKELKMKVRDLRRIKEQATELLHNAEVCGE